MNKIVLLFILIIGLVLFYYIKTNTDRKNIAFLNEYGWVVNTKGAKTKSSTIQDVDVMINIINIASDFDYMKAELSEIGIILNEEELDKVKIYTYQLEQYGIDEVLRASVWIAKGKIVFSYIEPRDVHIRMSIWPVNYDYEEIKEELLINREKMLEEYNK